MNVIFIGSNEITWHWNDVRLTLSDSYTWSLNDPQWMRDTHVPKICLPFILNLLYVPHGGTSFWKSDMFGLEFSSYMTCEVRMVDCSLHVVGEHKWWWCTNKRLKGRKFEGRICWYGWPGHKSKVVPADIASEAVTKTIGGNPTMVKHKSPWIWNTSLSQQPSELWLPSGPLLIHLPLNFHFNCSGLSYY